jgi:co-chaperonin GroES (HSP10)
LATAFSSNASKKKAKPRAGSLSLTPPRKKGDKILFGKWSGTEIKLEGEDLLIMKESDVLGVLA